MSGLIVVSLVRFVRVSWTVGCSGSGLRMIKHPRGTAGNGQQCSQEIQEIGRDITDTYIYIYIYIIML